MSFQSILQRYRSESYSESDKGTRFEELVARYLMTDPTYSQQLEHVWMWSEFPYREGLGGRDTGIDLVARTRDGEWWAVQCKCYAEGHTVTKDDMDTFLATSGRRFRDSDGNECAFSQRIVVATTDNWSQNAVEVTRGQTIPVAIVGLNILESAPVDWDAIEEGVHGRDARTAVYQLRPHQKEAVDKALDYYKDHDRGKMIMACGTGKTFTSLRIAEAILRRDVPPGRRGCVLFLAPSISLVGQTLREWMHNAEIPIMPICVCSDVTVTKSREQDDTGERVEDLGMPATTDAGRIAFRYMTSEDTVVIFSTYQSIDAVIEAQHHGLPEFDLIICDEAHRTTGYKEKSGENVSAFVKVHDDAVVRGRKRLYMTATPRLYGDKAKADARKAAVELCSMDDESKYGEEFYGISFGRAVELGLLSDYKVMILTTTASDVPEVIKRHWTGGGKEIDVDTGCKIWGCLNALAKNVAYDTTLKTTDPSPMRSAVSFCRSIKVSTELTRLFNDMASDPTSPMKVRMRHIDGSMNAMRRDELLKWLKEGSDECHVLSNVRCLSEGVDVPALDAVMFMDSKGSLVDVVQSVGRVMRKAPGKMYGYIIIPIVVPEDVDPEDALDDNERYKVVWQVLRALRSHDERLEAEINTFNYTKGGKDGKGHIVIGRLGDDFDGEPLPIGGQWTLDDFNGALMARLVLKVGDRDYIENWAKKVAEITPALTEQLTRICAHEEHGYKQYKRPFERYLKGLRECVNDNVSESQAIDMLAQQIITRPIFDELFAKDGFALQNPVSQTIDAMLREIDARDGLRDLREELDEFHRTVEITLAGIDTTEGKQKVITALYEKFFKNAFPKDQAINGVVYTPQEIVDFIIHSCAEVLQQEFGVDINDEGVNILDPFTGTGTFIARLMESGLITKENIERKYRHELFANEITLLAYYIATVNIENTYARITGSSEYVPFENILLTDTFNIEQICKNSQVQTTLGEEEEPFRQNKDRIRRENSTPITVIMGNPPYGANQKSANDDAKKRTYKGGIDARIGETYLNDSLFDDKPTNTNSVYDNYVRAFRWATDRIGDADGVISFVTPSGWLTSSAFEGFRKTIESEFSGIYVFNLRGDQNGSNWRQEGEKVFGEGSKVGIGITLLVRKKGHTGKAKIRYYAVPDGLKRQDKLGLLVKDVSFPKLESSGQMTVLKPRDNGDWIVQRNEAFQRLVSLVGDTNRKFEKHDEETVFVGYSRGYATGRDPWSYNFSRQSESDNMERMISEYNDQRLRRVVEYDGRKIKWNRSLEALSKKNKEIVFDEGKVIQANYRPFCKNWFYNEPDTIDMTYQMPRIYPDGAENLTICVAGVGVKKDFSCLMTNINTDVQFQQNGQCFPLYWYENPSDTRRSKKQTSLFDDDDEGLIRHDGISDYALSEARSRYGDDVTKEDIFYYIYGYLHSPDYREAFKDDLKLSLPRIGFVDSKEDFDAFAEAGRRLADLHLNYEKAEPYPDLVFNEGSDKDGIPSNEPWLRVTKMRLYPDERRLVYNERITISNIPEDAFRYMVNGRSALGWLVDQYQYTVDKDSGIVNDPNEYAGPRYVFDLVLSVITVSVETMRIVDSLPGLSFQDDEREREAEQPTFRPRWTEGIRNRATRPRPGSSEILGGSTHSIT